VACSRRRACSSLLGTLLIPQFTTKVPRDQLFLLGILIFGLCEASIGIFPRFAWVAVAYLLSGVANMAFIVPLRSILQLNTPPVLQTRTFAALGAVSNSPVLSGILLNGALEKQVGAPALFTFAGLAVSAVALWVLLRGGIAGHIPVPASSHLPILPGHEVPQGSY
jgi:hypothetical protein